MHKAQDHINQVWWLMLVTPDMWEVKEKRSGVLSQPETQEILSWKKQKTNSQVCLILQRAQGNCVLSSLNRPGSSVNNDG